MTALSSPARIRIETPARARPPRGRRSPPSCLAFRLPASTAEYLAGFTALWLQVFAGSGTPASAEVPPIVGDSDQRPWVVGVARDHPPYCFVDERGEPRGLALDLIESVAAVMGLPIEIRTGSTEELRAALAAGEVDILPDVPLSRRLEGRFALSLPHTDVEDGIFVRTDTELLPEGGGVALRSWLEGRTLVTLADDPSIENLAADPGSAEINVERSAADALRWLASGEADVAILPGPTGLLLIDRLGLSNLQILPFPVGIYSRGLSFAVRPEDKELLVRLDEGLVIVTSTRRYLEIYNRWQRYRGDDSEAWKHLLWILTPALALLAISAAWTFTLRRTVTRRTRELEQEMVERRRLEEQVQEAR
ncbi:MAG: transporter substrate-binding domain-containing protein, partial [Holophagales bacterium]|nr:transporter substrate-binding domain-containing protein [Holophagales bacterium]